MSRCILSFLNCRPEWILPAVKLLFDKCLITEMRKATNPSPSGPQLLTVTSIEERTIHRTLMNNKQLAGPLTYTRPLTPPHVCQAGIVSPVHRPANRDHKVSWSSQAGISHGAFIPRHLPIKGAMLSGQNNNIRLWQSSLTGMMPFFHIANTCYLPRLKIHLWGPFASQDLSGPAVPPAPLATSCP